MPEEVGPSTLVARFLKEAAETGELNQRLDSIIGRWPLSIETADLRQMILLRAWENQTDFRGSTIQEFWGWLRRLAWSIGIDFWRQHERRKGLSDRLRYIFKMVIPAAEDPLQTSEFVEWLVAGLSARERKALELKYFRGLKAKAAARRMRMSTVAFYQLHYRAIEKLRVRAREHR